MSSAHTASLPSLHLRNSSFCNLSVALPSHSSFFNPSVASPTSQLILQPFRCLSYVTAHSSTLLSLLLRDRLFIYVTCDVGEATESLENELCYDHNYELSSHCKLTFTSPTSQLILQPLRRFTYVTAHSLTLISLLLRHRLLIYVTWRAAHATGRPRRRWEDNINMDLREVDCDA